MSASHKLQYSQKSTGPKASPFQEKLRHIESLETLVDELTKSTPNQELIQGLMREVGISYCLDPAEQVNRILEALNQSRGWAGKAGTHESNL